MEDRLHETHNIQYIILKYYIIQIFLRKYINIIHPITYIIIYNILFIFYKCKF